MNGSYPSNKLETGLLPRTKAVGADFPVYGTDVQRCPIVVRSEWTTQPDPARHEWDDIFQNGYPACCLAGLANAIEFFLARTNRARTKLDWLLAWQEVTGGRGGAEIAAALTYCRDKGFPLADGSARIHLVEAWDCPDAETSFSAVMRGDPLLFGWFFPAGPHAECGLGVKMSGSSAWMRTRNTHGKSYGEQGWHDISEADIDRGVKYFGAWAIREMELRAVDVQGFSDAA